MNKQIRIRTLLYFDIFVDGRPVLFTSMRAKELLAILVHRRGCFVSYREIVSFMWPEEDVTEKNLARARNTAKKLSDILRENDIPEILEVKGGQRRLNTACVSCDYYDILEHAPSSFSGEQLKYYMYPYSWSELHRAED